MFFYNLNRDSRRRLLFRLVDRRWQLAAEAADACDEAVGNLTLCRPYIAGKGGGSLEAVGQGYRLGAQLTGHVDFRCFVGEIVG